MLQVTFEFFEFKWCILRQIRISIGHQRELCVIHTVAHIADPRGQRSQRINKLLVIRRAPMSFFKKLDAATNIVERHRHESQQIKMSQTMGVLARGGLAMLKRLVGLPLHKGQVRQLDGLCVIRIVGRHPLLRFGLDAAYSAAAKSSASPAVPKVTAVPDMRSSIRCL